MHTLIKIMVEESPKKVFISPDTLRTASYELASKVVTSGFRPDFMVALWRGGAPVGCYVHEFLKWHKIETDHIAIRTSKYTGIDQAVPAGEVIVHNLGYLIDNCFKGANILLVDDVWDSGHTIEAFYDKLKKSIPAEMDIDVHVATVYYKSERNKSRFPNGPDYYVHEASNDWLVFPHELEGLTKEEISNHMGPAVASLLLK